VNLTIFFFEITIPGRHPDRATRQLREEVLLFVYYLEYDLEEALDLIQMRHLGALESQVLLNMGIILILEVKYACIWHHFREQGARPLTVQLLVVIKDCLLHLNQLEA